MIPEGADGVVMIEYTEKLDEANLMVYKSISFNENIVLKGDDIKVGETALEKGRRVSLKLKYIKNLDFILFQQEMK